MQWLWQNWFAVLIFAAFIAMHMHELLEQLLPAFKWLTWWGFLLGPGESFLYGACAGLVFCPVYNRLHRRWGQS